jgi:hypothetical protein
VTRIQVLYWQDVPSMVKVGGVKRQLPEWFQQEIDRRAMEQGLLGSDAYLEHWEWRDHGERDGADADVAAQVEAELVSSSQPA